MVNPMRPAGHRRLPPPAAFVVVAFTYWMVMTGSTLALPLYAV